jgi:hypothetical protein
MRIAAQRIGVRGIGDTVPTSMMYQFAPNSVLQAAGLGDVAQPQPNAGTFSDVNCPGSCWWTGGVTGDLFGRQACWPCYNVCPAGTVWDTTALGCSQAPTTVSPTVPVVQQSPTITAIQAAGQAVGSWMPLIIAGVVTILVLPIVLGRR